MMEAHTPLLLMLNRKVAFCFRFNNMYALFLTLTCFQRKSDFNALVSAMSLFQNFL